MGRDGPHADIDELILMNDSRSIVPQQLWSDLPAASTAGMSAIATTLSAATKWFAS
jgi:hypothetical protein